MAATNFPGGLTAVPTAAEPPADSTSRTLRHGDDDVQGSGMDVDEQPQTTPSATDSEAVGAGNKRGVLRHGRGGRRKVSGFKRESPQGFNDFIAGAQLQHHPHMQVTHHQLAHHQRHNHLSGQRHGLGLASIAAAAVGFPHLAALEKKKRLENSHEEDRDGNVTELKLIIGSRAKDSVKNTVPLHHPDDSSDHDRMDVDDIDSDPDPPSEMMVDEPAVFSLPAQRQQLRGHSPLAAIAEEEALVDEEQDDADMLMDVEVKEVNVIHHVLVAAPASPKTRRISLSNSSLSTKFPFPSRVESADCAAFQARMAAVLPEAEKLFNDKEGSLDEAHFIEVTHLCELPRYVNRVLFVRCGGRADSLQDGGQGSAAGSDSDEDGANREPSRVSWESFRNFWSTVVLPRCADLDDVTFAVLGSGRRKLEEGDFNIVVEDVVQNHPGLVFLRDMDVFQTRYVTTVVARIFYAKSRNTDARMSMQEFRKDGILPLLRNLQNVDDINQSRDVFSYKHFYVMYCKFWELDTDHDLQIAPSELALYENSCLSPLVIDRVFSGAGRGVNRFETMSYKEFVWFVLAVEEKNTPHGIEYWFRCLDVDGDGQWSLWELKQFWMEQFARMREFRMTDAWEWNDFACSILDMVNPKIPHIITLSDLKRCRNAGLVFDMIFDLRKYDLHVRRHDLSFREFDDMYVQDRVTKERILLEGWDKFAERAYEELACDGDEDDGMHSDNSDNSSPRDSSSFYDDMWEDDVSAALQKAHELADSPAIVVSPVSGTQTATTPLPGVMSGNHQPHTGSHPVDEEHPAVVPMDIAMPPDSVAVPPDA
ncbi:Serine/threonine-protein phosphatase 2A regulatory subunit B'' subunit alpha [Geranomyces michiganensis]|nr:Serine/threonine-protein phosphatase 2A regulatory subunit B'' subunit alpha [Geranomyces michiganensis]